MKNFNFYFGKIKNIFEALLVPNFHKDLFSVVQIKDIGMQVLFNSTKIHFYTKKVKIQEEFVVNDIWQENLYQIELCINLKEKTLVAKINNKNILLWDYCFDHISGIKLQCLLKNKFIIRINAFKDLVNFYKWCVLKKYTFYLFLGLKICTSIILELIHTDLYRLIEVVRSHGTFYFMMLIDD